MIDLEAAQRRDPYAAGRGDRPRGRRLRPPRRAAPPLGRRRAGGATQSLADASMTSPCSFQFSPSNSMICMASIG